MAQNSDTDDDCVRVSRATLEAAVGVSTSPRARYFAFNNHEWHYESADLSKRPFCDMLDCPVIDMPKSDQATPPPTLNYNAKSLGTLDGPTPLSFQQGPLENCFLAAAMMAVSHASPDVLPGVLHENFDGSMTMALPGADISPVRFDSRLYVQRDQRTLLYLHDRDTWKSATAWAPFIEKGVAMMGPRGYATFHGGWPDGILTLFTGRMYRALQISTTPPDHLLELLRQANRVPMVVDSTSKELDVQADHAFAVLGVETDISGTPYVVVGDPRGAAITEYRSQSYDADTALPGTTRSDKDGIFRVTVDDFRRLFGSLSAPADMFHASDVLYCRPASEGDGQPYSADFKQQTVCTK